MKTVITHYGPYDVIHLDVKHTSGDVRRRARIVDVRDRKRGVYEMVEMSEWEWQALKRGWDRLGSGGEEACAIAMRDGGRKIPYGPAL